MASSSLSDFRAREEQLRRLDEQLNDKKNAVVRRAEELVKQQSERLARLQADSAAPPPSTYSGAQAHHPYGEREQGFLEETSGYRGRYETPSAQGAHASADVAASAAHSRPASGAPVRSHARPVSAASQEGRRRSGIPAPVGGTHAAASGAAAAPARVASASAVRITPSGLSSTGSRPQSRVARMSAAPVTAPAPVADPYAHADADPFDGEGGGGGGGDQEGVSGQGEDDFSDPLGLGGDDTSAAAGVSSTAGMSSAATLRVQKARIQALSANVTTLSTTLTARDKELAELKALVKQGNDAREKLLRSKEAAEKQAHTLQTRLDELASKAHSAEAKASTLKRDSTSAAKRRTELEAELKAKDLKLNRAVQEAERAKETMAKMRSGGGSGGSGGPGSDEQAKELASLRLQNKKLLQQRVDLLQGFRKQAKLVDLLRRQKMHVEMAKMLQFTEDEFAKTLDAQEI